MMNVQSLAVLASVLLLAAPASATPVTAADCIDAVDAGQTLRDAGKLRAARARFAVCVESACPAPIRHDCATWAADVSERMPAVRLRAHRADGSDLTGVRVTVDGAPFPAGLEGRYVEIDPGPHLFRFERTGSVTVERNVVIAERDHAALVDVAMVDDRAALGPASPPVGPPPPAASATGGPPLATYVLAGVGVLGAAGFVVFGLKANREISSLRGSCAPACTDDQLSPAHRDVLIANISLGVGVVALVAATVVWLTSHPSPAPASASASPR